MNIHGSSGGRLIVDRGSVGKYRWWVEEVHLDDGQGPPLDYYEWTVHLGPDSAREIIGEGFCEEREDARVICETLARLCLDRRILGHRRIRGQGG